MLINGRCHCGNFTLAYDTGLSTTDVPARACTCSFCVKHGGVWTSSATGSLTVTIEDSARANVYEFGTKTAQFHICSTCGVVPVVTCTIDSDLHAVVSVNALDGLDAAQVRTAPASFDAEDLQSRLERRSKNWIRGVRFVARPAN